MMRHASGAQFRWGRRVLVGLAIVSHAAFLLQLLFGLMFLENRVGHEFLARGYGFVARVIARQWRGCFWLHSCIIGVLLVLWTRRRLDRQAWWVCYLWVNLVFFVAMFLAARALQPLDLNSFVEVWRVSPSQQRILYEAAYFLKERGFSGCTVFQQMDGRFALSIREKSGYGRLRAQRLLRKRLHSQSLKARESAAGLLPQE